MAERYECIKDFYIEICDDDGFFTEKYKKVEKGSIWELDKSGYRLVGDNETIRLENVESYFWIEITEERFSECFSEV